MVFSWNSKNAKNQTCPVTPFEETITMQNEIEEPTVVLLRLMSEESNLMEIRQNLLLLREKLQSKLQEKVENKKNNIQKIRSEITELRLTCEELSKSLRARPTMKIDYNN